MVKVYYQGEWVRDFPTQEEAEAWVDNMSRDTVSFWGPRKNYNRDEFEIKRHFIMKTKYITVEEAVDACNKPGCLIPSEFLSTFPNNFGINLCSVKGFEVVMTDDDQYQSIRVDFIPVEHRVGIDGRENI